MLQHSLLTSHSEAAHILCNTAKSAKFVGCKIGDMRSRFRFWYPGFLWSGTVRVIRDSCEVRVFWVHVKIWSPFPSSPLRSFKHRQGQQIEVRFKTSSNQRLGVRSLPVIIVVCYWNHYCERLKFYRHNIYWQSPLLFCGFWHDLWWHLAWRLQFWVNSQIPCYENVSFSLLLVMFKYKG